MEEYWLILQSKTLYIFDLDNTLYDEFTFLEEKFKIFLGSQKFNETLVKSMLLEFNRCFRGNNLHFIIQNINSRFKLDMSFEAYKDTLRNKELAVKISFYPGVKDKMENILASGSKIRLLTNGNLSQQKQKIETLSKVFNLSDKVVYAIEHGLKPDPAGLNFIIAQEKANKGEAVLIGDSKSDSECAANAQIDFILAKEFFDLET